MLLGMLGSKYLAVPIAEGGSSTGLYVALGDHRCPRGQRAFRWHGPYEISHGRHPLLTGFDARHPGHFAPPLISSYKGDRQHESGLRAAFFVL